MKEFISGEVGTVYEGLGQGDSDHGNAPWYSVGFFRTEAEATEAVKSSGGWGTPGKVRPIQVIVSGDSLWKFERIEISPTTQELRAKALAKLTDQEKKVLGLK